MTANEKRSAWAKAYWAKLRAHPRLYRAHVRKTTAGIKKGFERQRMKGNFGPAFKRMFQ